ncbi:flippase [Sphingomonas segetis]|uniref:flippase n=1 Tax=Sphingomonas segetis TaxID=1104779 RepID=UPI0012D2E7E0|nr:flippase [Sphingomonas segetis]
MRKALTSSAWLLTERALTLLLNFAVSILVARYLGPTSYGSLSYAIAFVALLSTISYLGFGGIVVQELVRDRETHSDTMGVVIYSKLAAALFAVVLGNAIAALVVHDGRDRLLVLLISISMLFDVAIGLRLHFEARTESLAVAMVASASSALGAIARVSAVAVAAPVWVFALIISIQSAIACLGYVFVYRRSVGPSSRLTFRLNRAKYLFNKSWPLIISFSAATIYLKIDQFMLGQMRGMADVGTYAIAARVSEVSYVVPVVIVASVFPRLVELRTVDASKYRRRMRESIRYLFWLGMLVAVTVSFIARPLISWLFGEEFRAAGTILAIHVWACPAVFMGMIVEKWFVTEDLLKLFIGRQLMSAAVNVGLNFLLIPKFGGVGSAVATVVAYTLAYYLSCFTSRKTAQAGIWMSEAIAWPLIRLIRGPQRA